ncbi:MAG: 7,8-didemethyl-8-hydroxy-5-deazariboflavin synthase CofG, partial [Gammaproteobacteria bacterium]|nr:7,8-didemethyl-8-hydroxy-5-deazariboflavin synthase CofG [Gammaproteobacteria bacterium]MBT5153866.1 7,8-didemethyl-8-hydroxy-5-deazariboflavin synthase CofG [Gammaproteobacteria bacterium]MBT5686146.1 7,8-didemethyl-8-hydroxy-5-deazariboflavin synthase CofG [Gammaproteobacteria bacterium]MBT5724669.1 7,8-didemethyl-8-hydroxy-5-deazariboflavin synthase CofG [Gammaproteobacteria bacterium]MBT6891407.1 7,8-didemethyl-8-hydroxy-5-deazariboflavin synthase CofG [Gammaproteobacteria bacterium]
MTQGHEKLLVESSSRRLDDDEVLSLAGFDDTRSLMSVAGAIRDVGHQNAVSYSRKVFIPLTHLCRDVCHYCTFAQVPRKLKAPYLTPDEILKIAQDGARAGCKEALFTLGDKPELRYKAARDGLKELKQESTLSYLRDMAQMVLDETGLFPHLNPGLMAADELAEMRKVSISMGIMLESASDRLTEKGMPHYGSPDKVPARRIETLRLAGEAKVPFTSGILIGIGETRFERIESLLALRAANEPHGHIQEIIIQNFRAKAETLMVNAPEPDMNELLWTISLARIIFGAGMNIQAPPNLSPGIFEQIVDAGINDWGGVSPVTPDFVNPEAPWP